VKLAQQLVLKIYSRVGVLTDLATDLAIALAIALTNALTIALSAALTAALYIALTIALAIAVKLAQQLDTEKRFKDILLLLLSMVFRFLFSLSDPLVPFFLNGFQSG
jgi:Ca2+/Na+ antiporter